MTDNEMKEKWRLTTWLDFGTGVLIVTVAGRLPYIAVFINSIHNHNFSKYSLSKRELLSAISSISVEQ